MKHVLIILIVAATCQQCSSQSTKTKIAKMETNKNNKAMSSNSDTINKKNNPVYSNTDTSKVSMSDEDWKKVLPADVYQIARLKGTERPWTSKFEASNEVGTYYCAACGNPLFKSDTKFESGCGWPSFYEPISKESVIYLQDNSYGMSRTEVECGRCKAHLGHVFDDGPKPTGLRYCINGVVLDFAKAKEAEKKYNEKKDQ
jgi:peptide-methionine (R)-S-oxide reductase